ncbi:MAG: AAA family ATPase [Spirulina sp. SIO3F2]|nr:AAA family ATPase [Spirulina sp. SIO3F2]
MIMLNLTGYQEADVVYSGIRTLIYRAIRLKDHQPVIVKVLQNPQPQFSELIQFRHQYILTQNLDSPYIVTPLALERYGLGYALIMPDQGAISLEQYWSRDARQAYPQTKPGQSMKGSENRLAEFLAIAIQLAQALHYLSRQRIIHKDIKPANILIHPNTGRIQLIDFSIASLLPKEQQQLINPDGLEGTLAYISPEQTGRMNRGIDYRTDFYSLGVTFYELLTGLLPFSGEDPMTLVHCHIARTPLTPADLLNTQGQTYLQAISAIIMKLMAKNAEERYQSALGLQRDLEQCLQALETKDKIATFEPGEQDICEHFLIPEKLYGRDAEVQILLKAFEQASHGMSKMLLVAGYSGVGKTALVNEVHKPIVGKRGYFIKGKYDQFQRNIPFSAFVQAFQGLMEQLLGESDAQLQQWRTQILAEVGDNGQVIIETIPALEKIIGQQPTVPQLEGSAAQNRFNLLFSKFVGVFATIDHPLTIFLDDLQWADSASLDLLKLLMDGAHQDYLLLLGAYRDNEVFAAHPLMLTLSEIEHNHASRKDDIAKSNSIETLTLSPLDELNINHLISDTLLCSKHIAAPLSELVYQKTKGNPFFITQFLSGLHEDEQIFFEPELRYWKCNLTQVQQLALTDDVVEFMIGRLHKLPRETQDILKLAACMGNYFDLATFAVVCQASQEQVATDLWRALQGGFIIPESQTYKFSYKNTELSKLTESITVNYHFLHDRVQQAAYALIPDAQKATTHYLIGQILLQKTPEHEQEERIFELVGQLNYGIALIEHQSERDELARLNLIACHKAKTATAYQAGLDYVNTGLVLLGKDAWQRQYTMILAFHELGAELAVLCGDLKTMEQFTETVIAHTHTLLEQANVYQIKIQANVSQNNLIEALGIGQQFLHKLGIIFPDDPTGQALTQTRLEVEKLRNGREVSDLLQLPMMDNHEQKTIVQIAMSIMPATYMSAPALLPLIAALAVKLSIQYGNTPASASAYAWYGLIACDTWQDIDTGMKFARLALGLVDKLATKTIQPEVSMILGIFVLHRQRHLKETLALVQQGYQTGLEVGNLEHAGYNAESFCLNSFWCGQPLDILECEVRAYCHGLTRLHQLTTSNYCRIFWQSILNLQGRNKAKTLLMGEAFQEVELLPQWHQANDLNALFYFHTHKLMLCYLFDEIEVAQDHAQKAREQLLGGAGLVVEPAFYFYDSLIALSRVKSGSFQTKKAYQRVDKNQYQLQQYWAKYAPMNYQHKVELVAAEKCRILGKKVEAIELYDRAIANAKKHKYLQEEALANELAAKFYLAWGKTQFASLYLQAAYYGYTRWGAIAKADDLTKRYSELFASILNQPKVDRISNVTLAGTHTLTQTGSDISQWLDFTTLMKAAHTISQDIEHERVIFNLLQVIQENSGAQTIALMLFRDNQLMLEAKLTDGQPDLRQSVLIAESTLVPLMIINTVKHQQSTLLLADASNELAYAGDAYIQTIQPRSVLCLPLIDRGQQIGILYLENNQCTGAFTNERVKILTLLCAQAAIALENAQLYDQAQKTLQELQQTQLQLVQSEKMSTLENLVTDFAHEINKTLGVLKGNIQPTQNCIQILLRLMERYQEKRSSSDVDLEGEFEAVNLEFLRQELPEILNSMKLKVEQIQSISNDLLNLSHKEQD